jgi:hypothetical protein
MALLDFAIAAVAVYRLSHMLAAERGPFDLIGRWHNFVYERVQVPYNKKGGNGMHWFYEGITCTLCISFWVALLDLLAITFLSPVLMGFVNGWLALSGIACFMKKMERE